MPDIIRLLPESIANQIAAGEVVQRPASAVKELLENSIDAQAQTIKLCIENAGKTRIQIIDDGWGLSMTDARMSFERHATSKIATFEDLLNIRTNGFRGEALASIAAVSQVEMKSKLKGDQIGTQLQIEASEIKKQEPIATPEGTVISVKNLFYNVPARRNFLKSDGVEFKHIHEEFIRVALAHPQISFEFYHNDKMILTLEKAHLSKRIGQIFGRNVPENILKCSESIDDIEVAGFIGKPEIAKKTRGEQFFFVNSRYVKNAYLNHAVFQAFKDVLKEDSFPFYVLNISIDPKLVDINVHPTKTEVKFQDDRLLYGLINALVRKTLASFHVMPSLDFNVDVNFDKYNVHDKESVKINTKDKAYAQFKNIDVKKKVNHWQSLYEGVGQEEIAHYQKEQETTVMGNDDSPMASATLKWEGYIFRTMKAGIMLIDLESTLERIFFDKWNQKNEKIIAQNCLFPQQIRLSLADFSLVMDIKEEINTLGFEFTPIGQQMIVIQSVPSNFKFIDEQEVFEGFIEQYKNNRAQLSLPKKESLQIALATKYAKNNASKTKQEDIDLLVDQLFECEQPHYAPSGSPTFKMIKLDEIKNWFGK